MTTIDTCVKDSKKFLYAKANSLSKDERAAFFRRMEKIVMGMTDSQLDWQHGVKREVARR